MKNLSTASLNLNFSRSNKKKNDSNKKHQAIVLKTGKLVFILIQFGFHEQNLSSIYFTRGFTCPTGQISSNQKRVL